MEAHVRHYNGAEDYELEELICIITLRCQSRDEELLAAHFLERLDRAAFNATNELKSVARLYRNLLHPKRQI